MEVRKSLFLVMQNVTLAILAEIAPAVCSLRHIPAPRCLPCMRKVGVEGQGTLLLPNYLSNPEQPLENIRYLAAIMFLIVPTSHFGTPGSGAMGNVCQIPPMGDVCQIHD